jgi:hypothetical protein
MKRPGIPAIAFGLAAFGLAALALSQAAGDAVEKAQTAAQSWLAQTDSGKYADSWDAAAEIFKSKITKADWEKALTSVRKPLGAVQSRKLKSATFTRSLPQLPDGEYVIIQYDTRFESQPAAVETASAVREKDGAWRIGGYFIR